MNKPTQERRPAAPSSGARPVPANAPVRRPPVPNNAPRRAPVSASAKQDVSPKMGTTGPLNYVLIALIAVMAVALAVLGVSYFNFTRQKSAVDEQWKKYEEELLSQPTIVHGITIDGLYMGGLTQEEALERLNKLHAPLADNAHLSVLHEGYTFAINTDHVPIGFNTEQVVKDAYAIGHSGDRAKDLSDIRAALSEDIAFTTTHAFDMSLLADRVVDIAMSLNLEPQDASVTGFKPHPAAGEEMFTYEEGRNGRILDEADLIEKIEREYENKTFNDVYAKVDPIEPEVSIETVRANTVLASKAHTTTTNISNRNSNIALCSGAFDGRVLMPGEIFSINEATGPRTTDKGYKAAGAIVNGVLQDEPGGGVCQVSGTLYNAVLKADLNVVERHHHSWPSTYLPKALDASINYGTADFQFENSTEWPIYIVVDFEDKHNLTMYLYGSPVPDGQTIELSSEVVNTIAAPAVREEYDSSLGAGQRKQVKSSMAGYTVKAYKKYFDANGVELRTVDLHTDTYAPQQGIIKVGPAVSVETPPPDDTPSLPVDVPTTPAETPNPNEVPPLDD